MGEFIAVGEKYPLFEKSLGKLQGSDGGLLEALEGEGFIYTMFLHYPSQQEIQIIREKDIKVRLVEEEPFSLPLIQFGNSGMIFEMSFDPTLYNDDRAFQMTKTNNILTIILVDSRNHTVCAIRSCNLPLRFIQRCKTLWAKAFLEPDYSNAYKNWYEKKQNTPLQRLWDSAIYLGKMGESYDLNEIAYDRSSDFY